MAPQIININRKKYVVGLFWQPLADASHARDSASNISKKMGRGAGFALYTVYHSQIGLVSRKFGISNGVSVLAPHVINKYSEFSSFIAAFEYNGGIWLIAVRNGIILKDDFYTDANACLADYNRLLEMPDWGALFAPESFAIPRSLVAHLSDVINENINVVLMPIKNTRGIIFSIIIFTCFLFLLGYLFREPIKKIIAPTPQIAQMNPELVAEYQRQLDETRVKIDQDFPIETSIKQMPYDLIPDPYESAVMCYQTMGFLMQPIVGWVQVQAECGAEEAFVILRRSFGNLYDFYQVVFDLMPGVSIDEISESEIVITAGRPYLEPFASLSELDADSVRREIEARFQKISTPTTTNIEQDKGFNRVEFIIDTKIIPTEFIKIFLDIDGVFLNRVHWDAGTRMWNYEVIVYVKQ